eukprot:superscaffoldBa00006931_g22042
MATATLDDLQQIMPELAHGLGELLSYEGNVEEDFYLTFQVFQEEMGVVKTYNLKPGGDKIPVTKQNRKEYVQLYVDLLLNKSIYKQFAAFYHGFHSVCASDALMVSLQCVCVLYVDNVTSTLCDVSGCGEASLLCGRLLVGTFVALFFNLLTLLSVRNKPFSYVSE